MLSLEGRDPTAENIRNYQAKALLKEDMLEGMVGAPLHCHELSQFALPVSYVSWMMQGCSPVIIGNEF
jgi:hypothetical protein